MIIFKKKHNKQMIQNSIAEAQLDNREDQQNFKKFNEQIKHIIKEFSGQCMNQQRCLSQYYFTAQNKALLKTGKFNFYLKCFVKNQILTILIEMSLKQFQKQVSSFGSIKFMKNIKNHNLANQYLYQYNEHSKSIIVKIFNHYSKQTKFFKSTFEKILNSMYQLIYPIINPLKYKLKYAKKKLEYLADMLQILRRMQSKSTKLKNIRRLSFNKIRQEPLAHQNSQNIERFQKIIQRYKDDLFNKFEKEQGIFRCIKQLQFNKDSQWDGQQLGANSYVQKLLLKYSINQQSSVNSQSNLQIENAKKLIAQSKKNQQKKSVIREVTKQSWLIKKKPNSQGRKSFDIEKKVLLFLRGLKCYSLNSYYTQELSNPEKMEYFYSDYHQKKMFEQPFSNVKKYFRAFQSLCQGLVFLRENAISHRDLKPDNILLSKDLKSKIIDFGSACHNKLYFNDIERTKQKKIIQQDQRIINPQLLTSQQYNLTYFHLQPSVYSQFSYDQFNNHPFFDVYAFGVLLSEFMDDQLVRFEVGDYVWKALNYLSDLCKQQNPDDRPDPIHVYVFLEQFIKLHHIDDDCE